MTVHHWKARKSCW